MIIKLGESIELIDDGNELLSYQKNQILIYGFQKTTNGYKLTNDKIIETVIKLNSYLNDEGISFSAPESFKKIVDENEASISSFDQLRLRASNYKKADFDDTEFKRYMRFCDTNILRKLKPHQLKASYHMYTIRNAANFSVPGSGKTSTVLTAYEKMRVDGLVNCLVVVGPPSSFSSWKNEFKSTLGREPNITILSGMNKKERVDQYFDVYSLDRLLLLSFQTYANDYQYIIKFLQHEKIQAFIVIDEAHYMKQINGKWANAILKTSDFATARCVLTGTPCPRSYSDLFNLFDFIWGKNIAISNKDKAVVLSLEKRKDFDKASEIIKRNLDPFFYRVRKKDLGLTEPLFIDPIVIRMKEQERRVYDSIFKKISELSAFDDPNNIDSLIKLKSARIIRLRQILSYTGLLKSAFTSDGEKLIDLNDLESVISKYDLIEIPAKIDHLLSLVKEIRKKDKKILIWSNFISTIDLIKRQLTDQGYGVQSITGETPVVDQIDETILTREDIIDVFLDMGSGVDFLVANPGACAESISLHKSCHNAIYYDLSYNCSQYLQSLDRIHRVGGSETIVSTYYFLQYADTIDNDIFQNLIQKRDKMYKVVEYDSDIYTLDIEVFEDRNDDDATAYDRIFKK